MTTPALSLEALDTASPGWRAEAAALSRALGAPHEPLLFPGHFLAATLPEIGGRAIVARLAGEPCVAAFLFPRGLCGSRCEFTARCHPIAAAASDVAAVFPLMVAEMGKLWADIDLVGYDPRLPQPYRPSRLATVAGVELGRPGEEEARAVRELQRRIWGSAPEDLYPSDLHSATFGAATSLVARAGAGTAGTGGGAGGKGGAEAGAGAGAGVAAG